jgi:integrase
VTLQCTQAKLSRIPWNKDRLVGPKSPLKPKDIWSIRAQLQMTNKVRDLAMFNLALDSKLRGCDLMKLKVGDVSGSGDIKPRVVIVQQKTKRPVQFELTEPTRDALRAWFDKMRLALTDYIFWSRVDHRKPMGTRQYNKLVKRWVSGIGINPSYYGTHSMRRTKAAIIYKKTGNLRAVQLLLGHSKLESTVRYLGIEVDDALSISEQIDF